MEKDLEEQKIQITSSLDPPSLEISMDEQLIEQVLINLIKNSVHALEGIKNPRIELRAYLNKRGRPTIQVSDNGMGILKEVMDKIFIPFFTTKPSGSGIGLSLSRQILKLHGGTITAQSEPDKETTFTMTF
jgi:two-component system, NtrC family, nitrogen regulation sensor histidine kinase NtrY